MKKKVWVAHTGDQFVAYDIDGNIITNREILEAISFENFPGFKSVFTLELDTTTEPVSLQELSIKINLHNK
jgi:hypothetical protein